LRRLVPSLPTTPEDRFSIVYEVDGAGSHPCGGTLVTSTADLGEVRVRRISRQKGVSRVSYEVKRVGAGE